MISKTTIGSIAPLVGTFEETKRTLNPVNESILSALMAVSNTALAMDHNSDVGFHSAWVDSIRNSTVYGTQAPIKISDGHGGVETYLPAEMHDRTMKEAVELTSNSVVHAIKYTKTVVKPTIRSFLDSLELGLKISGTVKSLFDILPEISSGAWDSKVIELALAPLIRTGKPVIVSRYRIPQVIFENEVINKMSSGNKQLDKQLDEILKLNGYTRKELAASIFNEGIGDIGSLSHVTKLNGDITLAKFILVNVLADNPPSVHMKLSMWHNLMLSLSQAYGAMCGQYMRIIKDYREHGELILSIDLVNFKVIVDSTMYNDWLSNGGSPECLLGRLIECKSKNMPYTANIATLNEKAKSYNILYSRYRTSELHAENGRRELRTRTALRGALSATLAEFDISMLPDNMNIAKIIIDGNKVINKLHAYQLDDLGKLGTKLVCDLIFPFTCSHMLISSMDRYLESGSSVKEAEILTVSAYIMDWTLSSILIT